MCMTQPHSSAGPGRGRRDCLGGITCPDSRVYGPKRDRVELFGVFKGVIRVANRCGGAKWGWHMSGRGTCLATRVASPSIYPNTVL